MSTDIAHDILGFIPESEKSSLGPISAKLPSLTGAHYYPGYRDQLARILYLEAAYAGGPSFKEGQDRRGKKIFVQHERESDARYTRRRELTTYRNYVGPIVDAYANYVFTTTPTRSTREQFLDWAKNADRRGRSLHKVMKHALTKAILHGRHWIGADLPRLPDGAVATRDNDKRVPYVVSVNHANVVDFGLDETGKLVRIVIHHEIYSKPGFASEAEIRHEYHEWDAQELHVWKPAPLKSTDQHKPDDGIVVGMPSTDGKIVAQIKPGFKLQKSESINHGYGQVPFRCIEVMEGKGLMEDIAEANRTVLNLVGLLYEELYNNTFSQTFISGLTSDESDDVKFGTQTIIFLPNPEAGIHTAGANPEQARSIINALFNEVKEIHRMAHMEQSGEPLQKRVAEAASKKEKDSESMDQVLEELADCMQAAENEVLEILASFKTQHVTDEDVGTAYSKVFDTKTLREKISLIVDLDKAPFVPVDVVKGLAKQILAEVLEEGDDARKAMETLDAMTETGSPQGISRTNMKVQHGAMGPVQIYQAFVDPNASDEEARKKLDEIMKDKEKYTIEQKEEEAPAKPGEKPTGRPEKQPTPKESREKVEKQQAANQT